MSVTYSDITQWKILPISQVSLWDGADYAAFNYLIEGSVATITPIIRRRKTRLWHFTANILVLMDNYGTMKATLEKIAKNGFSKLKVTLIAQAGQPNGETMQLQDGVSITPPTVDLLFTNFDIKSESESPVLTINIDRYMSIDAVDASKFFITQNWS